MFKFNRFKNQSLGKYGSKKTEYDGISFPSKLEASVYQILKIMEKAGEIKDLKTQEYVYLTEARIAYIADFSYIDCKSGEKVWAEAKGLETDVWRIKRRLWAYFGPGQLVIYKGTYRNPKLYETITPPKQKTIL